MLAAQQCRHSAHPCARSRIVVSGVCSYCLDGFIAFSSGVARGIGLDGSTQESTLSMFPPTPGGQWKAAPARNAGMRVSAEEAWSDCD